MDSRELEKLKKEALDARVKIIREIASFGSGHIGGSMSVVEVLTYLYYHEMNIDPSRPDWPERDRLVISKGHSGPALYAMLAKKGYFEESMLSTLNQAVLLDRE